MLGLRRLADAVASAGRPARAAAPLRVLTVVVCVVAGVMMATGAIASRGSDLRPDRHTELAALVAGETERVNDLRARVVRLREDVDLLTRARAETGRGPSDADLGRAAEEAGVTPARGPAVVVTLRDAPLSVRPANVDEDLLVVHQQDIQAVANALWAGGAEAMTIQGQRVSARTGIKCVGNSVVIHNVPYAPPYVLAAIGERASLERALAGSEALRVYRQYADAYGLGYAVTTDADVEMPAYTGPLAVEHARVG